MRSSRKSVIKNKNRDRSDSNESLRSEISNASKKIRKKKNALLPNQNHNNAIPGDLS